MGELTDAELEELDRSTPYGPWGLVDGNEAPFTQAIERILTDRLKAERERIAQAIEEADAPFMSHSIARGFRRGVEHAARIARTGGSDHD